MPQLQTIQNCTACTFRSFIFDKLSQDELDLLDQSRTEFLFHKGEKIIEEGQEIKEFVYLSRGLVKLSKRTENNKEQIISISKPQVFIGFLSVFSQINYQYSMTAIVESNLCFIDIELIKTMIRKNGIFALEVLSKMSDISNEIIQNKVNISSKNLRGRIAYLLIYFSKEIFHNTQFALPITRREIGELINVSTENVIRVLSELRREGIIEIDGCKIHILNYQTLTKISRFG